MTKQTKKLTLADLAPKPYKLYLTHPEHGKLDAWIEVASALNNEYVLKAIELNKTILSKNGEDMDAEHMLRIQAELTATCVLSWDLDFFGMECTKENVVSLMSNMLYIWIRDQVNEAIADQDNFFTKA